MATTIDNIEGALLGAILVNPDRCLPLAVSGGVAVDWFGADVRRLGWDAMMALWADRAPVDALAMIERAKRIAKTPKHPLAGVELDVVTVQAWIDESPTSANFEYYLQLCRDAAIERRIKKAGARFASDVGDGVKALDAGRALALEITRILSLAANEKTISVSAVLEQIREGYAKAHQKRMVEHDLDFTPGIPLPWKKPNVASQGLQEGLYYLGARPSVGKTAYTLNLVRYWCERGVEVAFDSLDMAVAPMLKRPVSELSRVSLTKASFGTTSKADLEAIDRAIDGDGQRLGIKSWPFTLMQERDVDALRSWCVAAKSASKLDVLIVDFVQLLTTRKRHANDNEKLEYISGVLKSIAIDLDIPVLALSQLNRACEDDGGRVPTSSDLRGSGALEQDATAVWILHADRDVMRKWDEPGGAKPLGLTPNQTPVEFKGISPVRFIIAKNQNGQAGPDTWFPFVFYKKYCLFMLGDVDADPIEETTGAGATKKTVRDYSPLYAKCTHDWRCDALEVMLYRHGCLVGHDLRRDTFLADAEPPAQDYPKI